MARVFWRQPPFLEKELLQLPLMFVSRRRYHGEPAIQGSVVLLERGFRRWKQRSEYVSKPVERFWVARGGRVFAGPVKDFLESHQIKQAKYLECGQDLIRTESLTMALFIGQGEQNSPRSPSPGERGWHDCRWVNSFV